MRQFRWTKSVKLIKFWGTLSQTRPVNWSECEPLTDFDGVQIHWLTCCGLKQVCWFMWWWSNGGCVVQLRNWPISNLVTADRHPFHSTAATGTNTAASVVPSATFHLAAVGDWMSRTGLVDHADPIPLLSPPEAMGTAVTPNWVSHQWFTCIRFDPTQIHFFFFFLFFTVKNST